MFSPNFLAHYSNNSISHTTKQIVHNWTKLSLKLFTHKSIDKHVQCCVQDKCKVTNVNHKIGPSRSDIPHSSFLAKFRVFEVEEFVDVKDQSGQVANDEEKSDENENLGSSVFCSSSFDVDRFDSEKACSISVFEGSFSKYVFCSLWVHMYSGFKLGSNWKYDEFWKLTRKK